ncbi:MAG: UbiD family decarboxylase, partial [Planctomycetes bacterium]|nr:UbiD family decarboxylase [Planctomycetota bacterium]
MSIRSLADFLETLDAAGQLRRVSVDVSAEQEVAELTRRVALDDGPALVFQKIPGATMPLATNLLGTERRIAMALGAAGLHEIAPRLPGSAQGSPHGGWLNWLKAGLQGGPEALAPKAVRTAACQQVVRLGRDVDLAELPALTLTPDDLQPSLFGACVVSGGIEPGDNSLAQFDLPILDGNRLAIRWGPLDAIGLQFEKYRAAGQKMPIAVLLGAAPALTVTAAAAPREPALDPYLLAGVLGAEAIDVVTCRTIALQVPAEADIVIEGLIDPTAPALTDITPGYCGGFGMMPREAHDIHVTALTHRSNPLATATLPHAPPNEASALVRAVARLWLPATLRCIPALVDLDMPTSV